VCCRLVPPGPPDSVSVRCPMRLRYPTMWGGFLPECRHRHPVALPLHPSPPSGWVWDLPLYHQNDRMRRTLKNTCRARHTTKRLRAISSIALRIIWLLRPYMRLLCSFENATKTKQSRHQVLRCAYYPPC